MAVPAMPLAVIETVVATPLALVVAVAGPLNVTDAPADGVKITLMPLIGCPVESFTVTESGLA